MNQLFLFCGLVMLSATATPNSLDNQNASQAILLESAGAGQPGKADCVVCGEVEELDLKTVVFIEEEEDPFELGFDTADYLPEGFDPHKMYVDLKDIPFIEDQDEDELGFDSTERLPAGFDPYAAPADFTSVSYIETEDDFYPDLDTAAWLPEGFDPYVTAGENAVTGATVSGKLSR